MTVAVEPGVIPLCIARCCREWECPIGYPGGRCGLCGERPTYVRTLPESEWLHPSPPIRPT